MFDPSFAFWYSLGGAVVMPFVEPLLWLPALVIGRNSPRNARFWIELPAGLVLAFLIGYRENDFASMANLDATVKVIQFVRPSLATLLSSLAARLLWKWATALVSAYRARHA